MKTPKQIESEMRKGMENARARNRKIIKAIQGKQKPYTRDELMNAPVRESGKPKPHGIKGIMRVLEYQVNQRSNGYNGLNSWDLLLDDEHGNQWKIEGFMCLFRPPAHLEVNELFTTRSTLTSLFKLT